MTNEEIKERIVAPLRRLKAGKKALIDTWQEVTAVRRQTLPQIATDVENFTTGDVDDAVAESSNIDNNLKRILNTYLEDGIRSSLGITQYKKTTTSITNFVDLPTDIVFAPEGQVIGTNTNGGFSGCQQLILVERLWQDDGNGGQTEALSNITSATYMFRQCYKLEALPPNLTLPNVTNVGGMFSQCYMLRTLPSGLTFDNVTSAGTCFYGARITSFPNLTMSKCTNFSSAFRITTPVGVDVSLPSTLRCKRATDISHICRTSAIVDLGGAFLEGTGKINNANLAFFNCRATRINGWLNIGGIRKWAEATSEQTGEQSPYNMFGSSNITHCEFRGEYTFCFDCRTDTWGFQNLDKESIDSLLLCLQPIDEEANYDNDAPPAFRLSNTQKQWSLEVEGESVPYTEYLTLLGYQII